MKFSPAKVFSLGFTILAMLAVATGNSPASSCTSPPAGLVGWWKGDGNTLDSFAGNNGVVVNSAYTTGVDGQAFAFDPENLPYGTYSGIQVADRPAYALTNSLTIEGWIRPRGDSYIIFWRGDQRPGLDPYFLGMQGSNTLFNICDADGNGASVIAPVNYFAWTHVAATLDGSTGTLSLYTNGVLAAYTNTIIRPFGTLLGDQSPGVGIGNLNDGGNNFPFNGDVDEIGLYNRALSAGEIQAIYNAGSAGKCYTPQPPVITGVSPGSGAPGTTVTITGTNFSATASGDIDYFGAVLANVSVASPTSLTVTVPTGAIFVPITVTANNLMAYAPRPFPSMFSGSGQITNSSLAARLDLGAGAGPYQVLIADLDGDGKPDLTIPDGYDGKLSFYRNVSTNGSLTASSFAARIDLPLLLPSSGTSPYTVAAADLDGDGRLDLIAVNADNNVISILRNISSPGSLTTNSFAPRMDIPAGNVMRGLAVQDLNGDGKPEMVVVNQTSPGSISVFQNLSSSGNIAFAARIDFAVGDIPQGIAVGDLDGDGQPDLAVANYTSGTISVFRNAGVGGNITSNSFVPRVDLPALTTVGSIVMGDLDGDGKLDLVAGAGSISGSGAISVYRNTATAGSITTGSFAPRVDFAAGWVNTLALADLDGDGKLDITVVSQGPSMFSIFKNVSVPGNFTSASLAARVDYSTGYNPIGVTVGDLDGDGRPDIAFGNFYDATISIYRNQTPVVAPPIVNPPVVTGVIPAVGAPGTAVTISGTNFSAAAAANIVYFGAVQAVVSSASPTNLLVTVPAGAIFAPITVTVGGLTASSSQPFEPTFTGNGSSINGGSFAGSFNLNSDGGPNSAMIADLDGDGKPDVAFVSADAHAVSIFRNIGTNGAALSAASFAPRVDLAVTPSNSGDNPYRLRAADLDGDGKLDLIACEVNGSKVSIFHNIASPGSLTINSFEAPVSLATGSDCRFATVADLDADSRMDIVALNYGDKTISVFKNIGSPGSLTTNSFATPVVLAAPGGPYEVAIADLDGDGKPDLAVASSDSGTVSVYQNLATPGVIATNSFASHFEMYGGGGNTSTIAAVDLDGDGKLDLVTGSGTGDSVNVFRNVSSGGLLTTNSFAARVDFGTPGWMHTVSVADFNGDGKPDIGVVGELGSYMAIFQNTATPGSFTVNSFAPRVDFTTGYNAWGIAAGDLNGDGRPDVVFCNTYDSNIQIYQNLMPFGVPLVAPAITSQPTNLTVAVSNTAVFSVTATGTPPLIYQWNFNGTNIANATNAILTLNNVSPAQAGNYFVTVSNLVSAVTSSNAALTVYVPPTPPTIISQTPSQVVLLGNPATFTVNVSGSDPLSYFWSRNNVLIPGATNSSYTLSNVQLTDSGSKFSCFVTNAFGFDASTNATLKVIDSISNDLCSGAILVTGLSYTNLQSTAKATSFGDPVPDCVDGFGNGVWYQYTATVNGVLIVDTFGSDFDTGLAVYTGACDTLTEIACNDDTGGMTSQVTILTTAGVTYSILVGGYSAHTGNLVFHLTHLTPPAFVVQPANQSVAVGGNASFSATLTGALPMSFQWTYLNGTPLVDDGRIFGSTTASLIISNITVADAGNYLLLATNFLGSATSTAAVLNVLVPPTISTQPIGRSVPLGLPTTFSATAMGNPTPNYYQWQFNGTNIPGATGATYTISAVNTNHLGFYHLVASNSVGGTVSADAQLTFGTVAAWGRNLNNECLPPPNLSNVVAVAGNFGASFAVRTDGKVVGWGGGIDTNIPASASNVVAIAAYGNSGEVALRSDGTIVSWGGLISPALTNIVSLALGNKFAYALRAEGTLTNWGSVPIPGFPAGLSQITAIACGVDYAVALRSDGKIFISSSSVGTSGFTTAVTNVPASATNVIAVAAGYTYVMALRADGKVIAWGSGTITNLPTSLTNIVAISAGNYPGENYGVAVRADGRVVAWGDNTLPAKSSPPAALTNLVSIAGVAAPFHGLALVNDGSPVIIHPPVGLTAFTGRDVTLHGDAVGAQPLSYQWLLNGTNIPGATSNSLFISNVQSANAGKYQLFVSNSISTALSLAAPLTVVSNNTLTFLNQIAASPTNVYQGGKFTVGGITVLGNGPLRYQWFFSRTNNNYAVVVGATNDTLTMDPALAFHTGNYYLAVSNQFAGVTTAPVAVRVLFARAWGYQAVSNPPVNLTNTIALATGGNTGIGNSTYFALGSDGKLTSWASPGYFPVYAETNVSALSNSFVTAIAAGYQSSLALKSDGTVYAWGYGGNGQTNPPSGLNGVMAIAVGGYHDLALKSDGTVVGWGATPQNNFGQATNNPAATNVVAIAAGTQHSLALRADGTVVSWGNTQDLGQIPTSVTNVIAIVAGGNFNAALRANGTVVQWGNAILSYPVPLNLSNVVAISGSGTHCTALKNDGTVVSWGNAYTGLASNNVPPDVANVIAITSGGDRDFALFGTRAPAFTVQPWNRSIPVSARSNIVLAAKCAGVQPMRYQWQLNGTNVPGATNDMLILTNQPLAGAPIRLLPTGSYQLIASNAYGVVASKFAKITTFYPLGEALDATNLNWTTTGSASWFGQTNYVHPVVGAVNSSAARSGGIGALQETILQTTIGTNQSGSYSFWWKVSSEQYFDVLEFRVNGIIQASISGEVDWQRVIIPVAAGTNILQWRYSKDVSFDGGQDAGWVDQFAYLPSAPVIISQPHSRTNYSGTTADFSISASGAEPLGYQWRKKWHQSGKPELAEPDPEQRPGQRRRQLLGRDYQRRRQCDQFTRLAGGIG